MYQSLLRSCTNRRCERFQRFQNNSAMHDADNFYNLLMSLITNMRVVVRAALTDGGRAMLPCL